MDNISATCIDNNPICAISTPPGVGGIAVARISGKGAIEIVDKIWKGTSLVNARTHTAHYGEITDSNGETLDAGVATVFKAPRSFTGEDTVEISIHGSRYIQSRLINLLVESGCRAAGAGEFTRRAFVNGRLDLASAEAVADMIASESKAAHAIAVRQMKGDYSQRLDTLRNRLTELAALLELELDFSEEDVEFASRTALRDTAIEIQATLRSLASSFKTGAAIKNGVPVAIVGAPNAGKSTLLNTLLAEERALVSPIKGTTRDTIEETIDIDGIQFRLIDTAGLRTTSDTIEQLGINRTLDKISNASIVIWLIDPTQNEETQLSEITAKIDPSSTLLKVINKSDILQTPPHTEKDTIHISAKNGDGIETLRHTLVDAVIKGLPGETDMIVTNARHYESIIAAEKAISAVIENLNAGTPEANASGYSGIMISGDIIAQDLREAIHHLGAITGAITTTDILSTVFSRFCIGK
jgi:tRNA modification GTPase